jgi:signal transduction histidine kinase
MRSGAGRKRNKRLMASPSANSVDPGAKRRGRLFRRYFLFIMALVCGALLASGGISLYASYQENRAGLARLQKEKAVSAAARIEQFIKSIEQQLTFAALPQLGSDGAEQRRIEFLKLLRQAPAVTDITQLDNNGQEVLAVSRLSMDTAGGSKDRTADPAFTNAKPGKPWFGPVYFRKETEPYFTVGLRSGGGVTVAEVNLKFVWDVVSRIRVGEKGKAYVVDNKGQLVADPDIGLVLRKTDLSALEQVKAALGGKNEDEPALMARAHGGGEVLTAWSAIETLGWEVFVEQPVSEVYATLNATIVRTGVLLLAGLAVSAIVSTFLARSMVRPIRELQEGAQRIGAGELDQRIEVKTDDELESLAEQFNQMTVQLRESYSGLERKVEERTGELTESLEYQTAISEVLRVISESPTDVTPVFRTILDCARRLFNNPLAAIMLYDGGKVDLVATSNWPEAALEDSKRYYPAPPNPKMLSGRVILSGKVLSIEDTLVDPDYDQTTAVTGHWRRMIGSPMVKEGATLGVIVVAWPDPGRTPQRQADLLKTFADQAVIAIENVRLINETKTALERQTATAEILRVISSSPTDVQPVFQAIAAASARLTGADSRASVWMAHGGQYRPAAFSHPDDASDEVAAQYPRPIDPDSLIGAMLLDAKPRQVTDVFASEFEIAKQVARTRGWNAWLGTPLMREGVAVGVIGVARGRAGPFPDSQVALLQTFADQAVIAIENVRLFREIQEKSHQLEMANQHKSEFLANMSHELRTPLNAVIGFSEVLIEGMFGEMNEKQLDYVQDIHSSGRHLLSLINDILDLSKIEAGRMELEVTTFNLPGAIDNAVTLVRERAQRHGIELCTEVLESLGDYSGDERKFKQIMLNLLSNAVKFTGDGGRVTVKAYLGNEGIEVSVADTGIGIAPDDQPKVFEEFVQVGSNYATKREGTGLGLPLAKRFAELHGGRMWLESEPGVGSTFYFSLPIRAGATA